MDTSFNSKLARLYNKSRTRAPLQPSNKKKKKKKSEKTFWKSYYIEICREREFWANDNPFQIGDSHGNLEQTLTFERTLMCNDHGDLFRILAISKEPN